MPFSTLVLFHEKISQILAQSLAQMKLQNGRKKEGLIYHMKILAEARRNSESEGR